MIRRLRIEWPDEGPFAEREHPIRLLAASDVREPGLEHERNRAALEPIDGVLGCGDLEPDWLSFLADAFAAPLVYVRGNHDRGGAWEETQPVVPRPLPPGSTARVAGIPVVGLEWPGLGDRGNRRNPRLAWWHVLAIARREAVDRVLGRTRRRLVISHAPPLGAGDVSTDHYHIGFPAYRWLLDTLQPPLWLHGHTTTASVPALTVRMGKSTLVNVTGAVLIELVPPRSRSAGHIPVPH